MSLPDAMRSLLHEAYDSEYDNCSALDIDAIRLIRSYPRSSEALRAHLDAVETLKDNWQTLLSKICPTTLLIIRPMAYFELTEDPASRQVLDELRCDPSLLRGFLQRDPMTTEWILAANTALPFLTQHATAEEIVRSAREVIRP